ATTIYVVGSPASVAIPRSLHDALPISGKPDRRGFGRTEYHAGEQPAGKGFDSEEGRFVRSGNEKFGGLGFLDEMRACRLLVSVRSEEHTSELQSRENLVCRLLLEKKKK